MAHGGTALRTGSYSKLQSVHWGYTGYVPVARSSPGFAGDGTQALMFGGLDFDNGLYSLDFLTGAYTVLIPQGLASSPPARKQIQGQFVYDSQHDRSVLFGGRCSNPRAFCTVPAILNDTWVYNPATNQWTQANPLVSPPARNQGQMYFDSAHGVVVLYGGSNGSAILNDLWTFDVGTLSWTQQALPAINPGGLHLAQVAYAPTTQCAYIVYGVGTGGSQSPATWKLCLAGGTGFAAGSTFILSASNAVPTVVTSIGVVCPASGILVLPVPASRPPSRASRELPLSASPTALRVTASRPTTATSSSRRRWQRFNGDANRDFLNVQRFDLCTPAQTYNYYLTAYATTPQTSIVNGSFVWNGRLTASAGPASSSIAPGTTYVTSATNATPTIVTSLAVMCPASGILAVGGSGESAAKSNVAGNAFIGLAYSIARNSTATDNGNVVQSSALSVFNGDANRDFLNVQRVDGCTPGLSYTYNLTAYATTPQTGITNASFVFNGRLTAIIVPVASSFAPGTTFVGSATNATPTIVTSMNIVCPASGKAIVTASGESAAKSNFAGNAFIGLAYSIARDSTATDNGNVVQSSALAAFNGDANRDFLNVQRSDTCTPGLSYTYYLTVYATTPQTSIPGGSFVWNGQTGRRFAAVAW